MVTNAQPIRMLSAIVPLAAYGRPAVTRWRFLLGLMAGLFAAQAAFAAQPIAWGNNSYCQSTFFGEDISVGVTAIALGGAYDGYHTAALKNGRVIAWGSNCYGQCNVPTDAQSGVTAIAAGKGGGGDNYGHTLALKNGRVLAWGRNDYGQCNVPAEAQSGVTAIAAGLGYTVVLNNGRVIAWGRNEYGQCNAPAEAQSGVTAIAASLTHTLALKNGRVIAWGRNDSGQCNVPAEAQSGVTAIAAGLGYTVVLKNGRVIAWGRNDSGQCNVPAEAQSGVTTIDASDSHIVALRDGRVLSWGYNIADLNNVPIVAQSGVTVIAAGLGYTVILKNGRVIAWGDNDFGQCNVPEEARNGVTAIAAVTYNTVVLKNGRAIAWGMNGYVPEEARNGVTAIAASQTHTVVLKNGRVIAWFNSPMMNNTDGQCNVPAEAQSGVTAIAAGGSRIVILKNGRVIAWEEFWDLGIGLCDVPVETQSGVTAIAAGQQHVVALKNGRVIAWGEWGSNHFGQCNVPMEAQNDVSTIAAGGWHTVALKNGGVIAWGRNDYGQCNVPTEAQSGVTAIAAGQYHTLALKNGKVIAWGNNSHGECNVPSEAQSGVLAIAAGAAHTVALRTSSYLTSGYTGLLDPDYSWSDSVANELCSKSGMGSPVFVKSGNYRQSATDAVLPGRGLPLQITRVYNSKDAYDGPFSSGWNFNQTIQLVVTAVINGTETAVVRWANGVRKPFALVDGVYEPPLGCYDTLDQNIDGYLFTTPGGMRLQFNNGGFLRWQEDRNGNRVTYSLDLQNRISRATTADGRTLDYSYDPVLNRVNQITDWSGREWNYLYATNDTLVRVEFPDGSCNTLEYDDQNLLVAVYDAFSNRLQSASYDTDSQYTTGYGEGPLEYAMGYDPAQQVTTKIDSQDRSWSFRYNEHGNKESLINPAGIQVQMQWTPNQKLSAQVDPLGNVQHFEYDSRGNVTSISNAFSHVTRYTYETNFNQVTSITDPLGNVISNRYDMQGNLIWSQDARGFVTEFQYDGFGQLTNAVDARGHSTAITYNPHGELLNVTDPLGNSVSYTYDDRGNRLTMTDTRGKTWQYGYDIMDRLVAVTNPLGHAASYTYDANGNRKSVMDARSNTTWFAYDEYNRLASVSNALGHATAYEYDVYSNPVCVRNAVGNTSSNAYDILNRLVETTDPLGNPTSFAYDENGNRTAVVDALANATRYAFDPLNRMVSMTNAVGGIWEYAYDANNNILAVTDARDKTSENQYDTRNMVTNSANPLGQAYRYMHDGNGNVIERTDPNDATLVYAYDDANRLTNIAYPNGTTLSFNHDESGNVTALSNSTETVLYSYDPLNRVTNVFVVGLNKTVSYEYDAVGNRAAMIDPDGGQTEYEYDPLNRLTSLTDPGRNMWIFAYDAINRMTNMIMPNGIIATYQYDAGSRLTDLTYHNSNNAVLQSFAYTYDAAGNPVSVKREDNKYEVYEYDDIYQLTRVDYDTDLPFIPSTNWTSYTYDLVGNRLTLSNSEQTETYQYDNANRLLSVNHVTTELLGTGESPSSVVTFGWDDNGNMTDTTENGTNTWYDWDYDNKLVRVTYHDGTTNTFSYYPSSSLRHTKVDSTGTNQFVYDGQNLLQEFDDLGTLVAQYQYSLGIDSLLARSAGGSQQYYLRDMIGSVTAIANADEDLLATYRYDVFGTVRRETGAANNPYLFTSRRLDQDSGLYYYRARYMGAGVGRFVSFDPIGQGTGYAYVGNRPTAANDPMGLFWNPVQSLFGAMGAPLNVAMMTGEATASVVMYSLGGYQRAFNSPIGSPEASEEQSTLYSLEAQDLANRAWRDISGGIYSADADKASEYARGNSLLENTHSFVGALELGVRVADLAHSMGEGAKAIADWDKAINVGGQTVKAFKPDALFMLGKSGYDLLINPVLKIPGYTIDAVQQVQDSYRNNGRVLDGCSD